MDEVCTLDEVCRPVGDEECLDDLDCPVDQICIEGVCEDAVVVGGCLDDIDCPVDQYCLDGSCTGGDVFVDCYVDSDCADDEICDAAP